MITLQQWFEDLVQRKSAVLSRTVKVEGLRAVHTGPRLEYGRVVLEAKPADVFSVEWSEDLARETDERFILAATFGVLDVVLGAEPYPLKNFTLRVLELQVHPIDSSYMAFRRAGQDAGRKLLKEAGLVRASLTLTPPPAP